jgi:hypothetical protein
LEADHSFSSDTADPRTWVTPPRSVPPAAEARKEIRLMAQLQPYASRAMMTTTPRAKVSF